ncbi:MAG: sugar phosphate isomerase/epimerase [Oscillospiraceae bacterium]|jgi:sugar phosphate isomerase/epimerase|nr:sugar phosphate isomerase/epimerase [Oscillospiraceae bacterium]
MKIGAQLYSVRDLVKTPEGQKQTITTLADIGYKWVQLSPYAPFNPDATKALCDSLGVGIKLTHVATGRLLDDIDAVIEEHKRMDNPNIGIGALPGPMQSGPDGARAFLKEYAASLAAIKKAGLRFQYHNHAFEFLAEKDGETIWDVLLNETDPDVFGFTLDTYWVAYAGRDVAQTIRQAKGRVQVCHYKDGFLDWKDEAGERQPRFTACGDGDLVWQPIYDAFAEIGTEYAFVEQDSSYNKDPIEELARSYRFLTK